jgi:hypothetical protein
LFPYFVLIAIPGLFALSGARRRGPLLLFVVALYWLFIGLRFQVGTDWNGYVRIYEGTKLRPALELMFQREPGFKLLMWLSYHLGGGLIMVNAVSAFVFCGGLYAVAKRCIEPFMALVVATPLLVVAFAMSATRQSLAVGIIFYLFATWDKGTTLSRLSFVAIATLFHFSSLFVLVFVALATRIPLIPRLVATAFLAAIVGLVLYLTPETASNYSDLYISGARKLSAPGAWIQVGAIAAAGLTYFVYKRPWAAVIGENPLYQNLAVASLLAVPMIYISSVGAYRFALFFWPMAMYVWASAPALMGRSETRLLYRTCVIAGFAGLLWGWLTFATNSAGWIPYKNWLLQPESVSLWR